MLSSVKNLQELISNLIYEDVKQEDIISTINKYTNNTIKVIIEFDEGVANRILLTTNRKKYNPSWELHGQCNGVVLYYPTWELLSLPPRMCTHKVNVNQLKTKLSNYTIYPIFDGTVVTLYWYEPADIWCMSTTNGFDVSNYRWMGLNTYWDEFNRIADKYYPNFSFDALDKSKCYSIGFRSKEFHPFIYDKEYMWYISSCELSDFNMRSKFAISYDDDIGLCILDNLANMIVDLDINKLKLHNKCALSDVYNQINNNAADIIPHYGYIFRSKNNNYTDIILESSLMSTIRELMYNIPKSAQVDENNRKLYMALRSYLSCTKTIFADLFSPLYYDKFDQLIADLVGTITKTSAIEDDTSQYYHSIKEVSRLLQYHLISNSINIYTLTGHDIIKDAISNVKYISIYMNNFYTHKPTHKHTLGDHLPKY